MNGKIVITDETAKKEISSQLIRSYMTGTAGSENNLKLIQLLTGNKFPEKCRLFLIKPRSAGFSLNTFCKDIEKDSFFAGETERGIVAVLSRAEQEQDVKAVCRKIMSAPCCGKLIVAAGEYCAAAELPAQYAKTREALGYKFYKPEGGLVYSSQTPFKRLEQDTVTALAEKFIPNPANDTELIRKSADKLCEYLAEERIHPCDAKLMFRYFLCGISDNKITHHPRYLYGNAVETTTDFKQFVADYIKEICYETGRGKMRVYSSAVKQTIQIIEENISNENLSLRWLAGTILYTNVDYLGKLFKKETGKNFSHYVKEMRMEMAKQLILEGKSDKIYEVAEKVGYGSNSQYFSQVFKKYTGISPLEYKEFVRKGGNTV